jgi:hypothetical protein
MAFWLTIEVQHGATPADAWRRAHGEALIEAAVTNGAVHWEWHTTQWGLILELEFRDEQARNAFRELPAAIAALDAVPDPVLGLLVYPGRGGGSGAGKPRRPRPAPIAGAAEAEEPREQFIELAPSMHARTADGRGHLAGNEVAVHRRLEQQIRDPDLVIGHLVNQPVFVGDTARRDSTSSSDTITTGS